jgi:hypothetical protein
MPVSKITHALKFKAPKYKLASRFPISIKAIICQTRGLRYTNVEKYFSNYFEMASI